MMLSYNSSNLSNSGGGLAKLVKCLAVVVVAVSFYTAGIFSQRAYAEYPVKQVDKTCKDYLMLVFTDKLDAAYSQSSSQIQIQKLEDFKVSFAGLKTDKPSFQQQDVQLIKTDKNKAVCNYIVNNLPATSDGRTDGVFTLGLVKEGREWKVDSISIQ